MVVFDSTLDSNHLIELFKIDNQHNVFTYVIRQLEVFVVSVKVQLEVSLYVNLSQLSEGLMSLISVAHLNKLTFFVIFHDGNATIFNAVFQNQDFDMQDLTFRWIPTKDKAWFSLNHYLKRFGDDSLLFVVLSSDLLWNPGKKVFSLPLLLFFPLLLLDLSLMFALLILLLVYRLLAVESHTFGICSWLNNLLGERVNLLFFSWLSNLLCKFRLSFIKGFILFLFDFLWGLMWSDRFRVCFIMRRSRRRWFILGWRRCFLTLSVTNYGFFAKFRCIVLDFKLLIGA